MMVFIIGFISGAFTVAAMVWIDNLLEQAVFHEGDDV